MRYNQWRKAYFDPAVAAAGLTDVTPHDLRASHGTRVADRYGVMTAAHRLGHSNASVTTRHYAGTPSAWPRATLIRRDPIPDRCGRPAGRPAAEVHGSLVEPAALLGRSSSWVSAMSSARVKWASSCDSRFSTRTT